MRGADFGAVRQVERVRPAFTVKRLSGEVDHEVHIFDKKENRIKKKSIKEPAGFLVTFMKGHSIRCRDEEHLRRIGAGTTFIPLVDTESDDIVGSVANSAIDTSIAD